MNSQKKCIALMGVGYWGRNILRNLYEMEVLRIACDINPEVLTEQQEKFPDIEYSTSFEDVLNDSRIKAVAIATPAVTHYKIVKQSLLADKDVFVEKPLSLTLNDGKELVELASKRGRVLMVGHILQYHPVVIKLKEIISEGILGKIQYIYSNRLNIGKLRVEENILWSFAPHDISVILYLLDEEPIKVSAFGGDYLNNGVYDTTMTILEFKNKVKGHIFVSWIHPFKEQKLIVVGSKAMAVFDDVGKEKLLLYPHKIEWREGKIPVAQKADYEIVPYEEGEPLKRELNHFIECIQTRNGPRTDGNEGLRVLRVIEAAEDCLLENKQLNNSAMSKDYYVHNSSFIDENVTVGEGTKIWHFSHLLKGSRLGKKCIIGQNVVIGPEVTIGNGCKIQNNVSIYKGVTLEDGVFCGPSCVFTNVYNPRAFVERKNEFMETIVRKGATIGANATIVCGVTIGKYALIGAGAVVKSSIPDHAIVGGVPAKQIGWACKCGAPLKSDCNDFICSSCGNEYKTEDNKLNVIKEGC